MPPCLLFDLFLSPHSALSCNACVLSTPCILYTHFATSVQICPAPNLNESSCRCCAGRAGPAGPGWGSRGCAEVARQQRTRQGVSVVCWSIWLGRGGLGWGLGCLVRVWHFCGRFCLRHVREVAAACCKDAQHPPASFSFIRFRSLALY